jgi:hypothetical protein
MTSSGVVKNVYARQLLELFSRVKTELSLTSVIVLMETLK